MRAIIQKVKKAKVKVDNKVIGKISRGFLVFIAIHKDDVLEDLNYIKHKVINLRIFEDEFGKMNKSIEDVKGEFLIISQFTLYGDSRKGNRPNFFSSAKHDKAKKYYDEFIDILKKETSSKVESGEFAAHMKVSLINDGPVTIQLDSSKIY